MPISITKPTPGGSNGVWAGIYNAALDALSTGAQQVLTLVSAQTSAYTASADQIVPTDVSGGAFTVTLPTAPANGVVCVVAKLDTTTNATTIATAGSDVFSNPGSGITSQSLALTGQTMTVQYWSGVWTILSDDYPLAQLDQRYAGVNQARPKQSVTVCSTSNITLTAPGAAIDGVTLSSGVDRVLLVGQTAPAENGIFLFNGSASTMTRTSDANSAALLIGAFVFVNTGLTQAGSGWEMTSATVVVGTSSQTWVAFQGPSVTIPAASKSGTYAFCNSAGLGNTGAPTINAPKASPWEVTTALSIARIGCEFTVAGSSDSVFHLVIWADDGHGWPSAVILDVGTISTGTGNAGTVTTGGTPGAYEIVLGSPLILAPGLYWPGGMAQGTSSPTMRTANAPGLTRFPLATGASIPAAGASLGGYQAGTTQTGAATTFASPSGSTSAPRIFYKVS